MQEKPRLGYANKDINKPAIGRKKKMFQWSTLPSVSSAVYFEGRVLNVGTRTFSDGEIDITHIEGHVVNLPREGEEFLAHTISRYAHSEKGKWLLPNG